MEEEPIGLASGLLALGTFAFQTCNSLCYTVGTFKIHPQRVRDLTAELGDLSKVLGSLMFKLTQTVNATTDINLSLNFPLLRCANSCKDFQQEIIECSSRSGGNRTSFRDWAKLRYMGENLDSFRQVLAGYKSTIIVALNDANLRKSSVNAEGLETYRNHVKTATDNLEAHLQSIDEKLLSMLGDAPDDSTSDSKELLTMKEERLSTEKSLQICAQLSDHINQIQLTTKRSGSSPRPMDPDTLSETLNNESLQECKNSLALTITKLEGHMKDRVDRMMTKLKTATSSDEEYADLARLRDEWETALQTKAGIHLKENITTIHNYATGDAVQFLVSTDGKPIRGKNQGLGRRTRQVGGHLSDASLQQLSHDMAIVSYPSPGNGDSSSRGSTLPIPDDEAGNKHDRYGPGSKLAPTDTPAFSTLSAEGKLGSSPK